MRIAPEIRAGGVRETTPQSILNIPTAKQKNSRLTKWGLLYPFTVEKALETACSDP